MYIRYHAIFDRGGHKLPSSFPRTDKMYHLRFTGVDKGSYLLNYIIMVYKEYRTNGPTDIRFSMELSIFTLVRLTHGPAVTMCRVPA